MAASRLFSDPGDQMLANGKRMLNNAPLKNDRSFTEFLLSKFQPGPGLLDATKLGGSSKGEMTNHTTANTKAEGRKDDEASNDDYDLSSDDEEHDSDDDVSIIFDPSQEEQFVGFLNGLNGEIAKKHNIDHEMTEISVLRPGVHPYGHQTTAAAAILRARKSLCKGLILADPSGPGKTLSSLIAIASAKKTGHGPSLIVAPNSCCKQWVFEAKRFLQEPTRVLLLQNEDVSPTELFTYDLVVTPYSRVAAELSRLLRYERQVQNYTDNRSEQPKRPHLSLLSGFYKPQIKPWGPFLVLDEAHTIKNTRTLVHAAVLRLRDSFETCVMLTGTALDNTS